MMDRHAISLRRLRQSVHIRELTRRVRVSPAQLIQPLFVVEGLSARESVPSLSGVYRETPTSLLRQVEDDLENGVSKFLLFGVPGTKSTADFHFVAEQIQALKDRFGDSMWLATDVCLCSWTEHGHCGVVDASGSHIDNHASVELLVAQALQFAQAGADCIAPSDMMDGRIGAIREALSAQGGERKLLMSYAAKFHSNFYGPFRLAANSTPTQTGALGDRSTYQIDPARPEDALAAARRDAAEGADILLVKPGTPYLDVLQTLSREIADKPWAVYQVSGEYGAIELMAAQGLLNREKAHTEALTGFIRAGASMIITYGARYGRRWLKGEA